jgi:S1-C subfamily serine protease
VGDDDEPSGAPDDGAPNEVVGDAVDESSDAAIVDAVESGEGASSVPTADALGADAHADDAHSADAPSAEDAHAPGAPAEGRASGELDLGVAAEVTGSGGEIAVVDGELVGEPVDEHADELLPKNLPQPYCQRPWREMVGGLLLVALLVAGVTIYRHGSSPVDGPAVAGATPGQPVPVMPAGVTPVAFTAPAFAAAQPLPAGSEPRTAFNAAAHVVRPSVVGIRAVGAAGPGQAGFERVGSGIIVSSGGYVLTCTHVIQGASRVAVSRFRHAEERIPAQVVATEGDLALLRVATGAPMPAARFADPRTLRVGDWILALGHPFGMGLSVSAGIVSRRNAELTLPSGQRQQGLVQTDASINEGSSGGPLVNLNGEVVGLNMAILAPTGVFNGAGFAIDGVQVLAFLQRYAGAPGLMAGGAPAALAPGAALGLGLLDLTPSLTVQAGYPQSQGALITNVIPSSPAHLAQLNAGDIITAIGDRPIATVASVSTALGELAGTTTIPVQIWRNGQYQTLMIRLFASSNRG